MYREALKKSWNGVKRHPWLVVLLVVLQLGFLILLAFINVVYQLQINESLQAIINGVGEANYDEEQLKAGMPFMQDFGVVMRSYELLIKSLQSLVVLQVLAFLVVGTLMWALTHRLFQRENFFLLWGRLALRAVTVIFPALIVIFMLLRSTLAQAAGGESLEFTLIYISLAVAAAALYILVVGLGLPTHCYIRGLQCMMKIASVRAYYVLPVLLASLLAASGVAVLMYLATNYWPFWAMLLSAALLVVLWAGLRIVIVGVVIEIDGGD